MILASFSWTTALANSEQPWTTHIATNEGFSFSTPSNWTRYDPTKSANSPMGDIKVTSPNDANGKSIVFFVSVDPDLKRTNFYDFVRYMEEVTHQATENRHAEFLRHETGTHASGCPWTVFESITKESGTTNYVAMIIIAPPERRFLIGTAIAPANIGDGDKEILTRIYSTIRTIEQPNKALQAIGAKARLQPER